MYEGKFSEYWTQAQFCYIKAETAEGAISKQLWIELAHDWIALSEAVISQTGQISYPPEEQPFLVA